METIRGVQPFVIRHSMVHEDVKKEDVVFIRERGDDSAHDLTSSQFCLYCLCDGHQGVEAANFVKESLWNALVPHMPQKHPPLDFNTVQGRQYAEQVRVAITLAFVQIDKKWQSRKQISGCTATAAIVTGKLLTVANVGDSRAILIQSESHHKLTVDHRVNSNQKEQQRLKLAGAHVSRISTSLQGPAGSNETGLGPLRVWPGGLSVSRSIGDIDVGPIILPTPYVQQIILPENGSRLLIASDGLWDTLKTTKVAKICRFQNLATLGGVLINHCKTVKFGYLIDDTTILAVDFLPDYEHSFAELMVKARKAKRVGSGGGRLCFCGGPPVTSDEVSVGASAVWEDVSDLVFAEEDTSKHYNPLSGLMPEFSSEIIKVDSKMQGEDSDCEQTVFGMSLSENIAKVVFEEKAKPAVNQLIRANKSARAYKK